MSKKTKKQQMKVVKFVLLLSVLSTAFSCKGQGNTEVETNPSYSTTPGEIATKLSDKIWAVYQDQQDNYWFGSNGEGVFLYDGHQLRKYTEKDGLTGNSIRGIQEDSSGHIFIETPSGVSQYDGKTFTTLTPIISDPNEWTLGPDDLWFNCNGNANDVYRYDGKNLYQLKLPKKDLEKAFGINEPELSNNPYSIFGINRDKDGNMWFGTEGAGAFRYDGVSFLWIGEKELSQLEDGRVPGVRSMIEDKDGYFWLSNVRNRYRVEPPASYEKLDGIDFANQPVQMNFPYFMSAVKDNEKGNLWMITYSDGVWEYDGENLRNYRVKNGETEVLLISIYKDNKGQLLLGTDNAGVYQFNGDTFEKFEPWK